MTEHSALDDDFYKVTQQQAVLETYPNAIATYEFRCRKSAPLPAAKRPLFFEILHNSINEMGTKPLQESEGQFLRQNSFLHEGYMNFLTNFRQEPKNVSIADENIDDLKDMKMRVQGLWRNEIRAEVKLMWKVSDAYFKAIDTNWSMDGQEERIYNKAKRLNEAGCKFADFGTRRRRNYETQDMVVRVCSQFENCVGTSNVHLAHKYNLKPIGTQAHEWTMAISGLESLRYANRFALQRWNEVFKGDLGIALPDTFGITPFFEDFDAIFARLFDGLRHDSGDPFVFVDRAIDHYKKLKIDYRTKTIVFSDGLNVDLAIRLNEYCAQKNIKCSFGIGTYFTNDFPGSPALNMVIKLYSIQKDMWSQVIPVVKLGEGVGKGTGDLDAQRVAYWMMYGRKLDYVAV